MKILYCCENIVLLGTIPWLSCHKFSYAASTWHHHQTAETQQVSIQTNQMLGRSKTKAFDMHQCTTLSSIQVVAISRSVATGPAGAVDGRPTLGGDKWHRVLSNLILLAKR